MEGREFVQTLCRLLCHDLLPISDMREFTGNNDIYGAFAEARVRQFVKRFVAPLRVSHGAIAYEGNCGSKVQTPQLDTIIWQPSLLPAIFEADDFAIVPRGSAVAYMEIKATPYRKAAQSIKKCMAREDELAPAALKDESGNKRHRAIGVFCYTEKTLPAAIDNLVRQRRAAVLLDFQNGKRTVRHDDVVMLAQFLTSVRMLARLVDGVLSARLPAPIDGTSHP